MSQNNNSTTLFFGLDMAKASLPLHLAGNVHPSPTTPKAIANWSNGVRVHPHAHAVCEATGGYEQIILAARRRPLLDHKIMTQNHAEHGTAAFSKKPLVASTVCLRKLTILMNSPPQKSRLSTCPLTPLPRQARGPPLRGRCQDAPLAKRNLH